MKPKNNRIFCIGCKHTKMLFETQAKAENFLKFNQEDIASKSHKVPTRSYYCSFCCGWHVTSLDDEEKAKQRDLRDEKIWESINNRKNNGEQIFPKLVVKRRKLPFSEEGNIIRRMLDEISIFREEALIALFKCDFKEAEKYINKASEKYKEVLSKSTEFEIACKLIDRPGELINQLKYYYDLLVSLAGKPIARKEYIRMLPEGKESRKLILMIKCLDGHEEIKSLLNEAESSSIDTNFEKLKKISSRIERIIQTNLSPVSKKCKNVYRQKIDQLLTNRILEEQKRKEEENEAVEKINGWYRELILVIIEKIELSYKKIGENDFDSASYLLDEAEEILPDDSDENVIILTEQIYKMRTQIDNLKYYS